MADGKPLITLLFLLLGCVPLACAEPVYVSLAVPNYTVIPVSAIQLSSPSQHFSNLPGVYVSTALSVTVPGGTFYDILGVEYDFVIGRRPLSSSEAMTFDWDGSQYLTSLSQPAVDIQMDCSGVPCGYSFHKINATRVFRDARFPWGWVYRANFITPSTENLTFAATALNTSVTMWLNFSVAYPGFDARYSYKVMQPTVAGTSAVPRLALLDPSNILGHGWSNWTGADVVSPVLLSNMANPVVGHRIAATVRLYDTMSPTPPPPPPPHLTPSAPPAFSPLPSPPGVINITDSPTPSDAPSNGTNPIAPVAWWLAMEPWQVILITLGAVIVLAMLAIVVIVSVIKFRRRYDTRRRNDMGVEMTTVVDAGGYESLVPSNTTNGGAPLAGDSRRTSTSHPKIDSVRSIIGGWARSSPDDSKYQRDGVRAFAPVSPNLTPRSVLLDSSEKS